MFLSNEVALQRNFVRPIILVSEVGSDYVGAISENSAPTDSSEA
jgi:hypothetical protein